MFNYVCIVQAGLFDGTVAIYNVRSADPDSALDSRLLLLLLLCVYMCVFVCVFVCVCVRASVCVCV